MTDVYLQDIQQLMEHFSKNLYRAKDCEVGNEIIHRCNLLLRLDYAVTEIANTNGELTTHYPAKLLIPERELHQCEPSVDQLSSLALCSSSGLCGSSTSSSVSADRMVDQVMVGGKIDAQRLRTLISRARFARCRARFPLPVILFRGKYVCRSATLSGGPEIYGRSGLEYLSGEDLFPNREDAAREVRENSSSEESESKDWALFGQLRRRDIRLLKALNVGTIIDFMVENKKVKFGLNVTSSEKVDKENRYSQFKILALPYPGCEFFRKFHDNPRGAEGLVFDWSQSYVDASIRVPSDSVTAQLNIDWSNYKQWELHSITQNYLRLLVKYLEEGNTGILVHCISGWDRTPLFVSLLRISLWADGLIHQSLNAGQMLYLTIAYDWYLFGHNLPDRLGKHEAILHFCFYMLKYIKDDDFAVAPLSYPSQRNSESGSIDVIGIGTSCDNMLDQLIMIDEDDDEDEDEVEVVVEDPAGSNHSLNSIASHMSVRSCHNDPRLCNSSCSYTMTSINGSIAIMQCKRSGSSRSSSNGGDGTGGGDEGINSYNGNNGFSSHSHDSSSSIGSISQDSSNHNIQWSTQPKRTSPVTVPTADRLRQRQESTSSMSVGSWQMINVSGSSLRSADSIQELPQATGNGGFQHSNYSGNQTSNVPASSHSFPAPERASTPNANHHPLPQSHGQQPGNLHTEQQSPTTGEESSSSKTIVEEAVDTVRGQRLEAVRAMFYNTYLASTTRLLGTETGSFGSLFENLAEKVGFANRTST